MTFVYRFPPILMISFPFPFPTLGNPIVVISSSKSHPVPANILNKHFARHFLFIYRPNHLKKRFSLTLNMLLQLLRLLYIAVRKEYLTNRQTLFQLSLESAFSLRCYVQLSYNFIIFFLAIQKKRIFYL